MKGNVAIRNVYAFNVAKKIQIKKKYFLTNFEVEIFSVRRRKYFKESALTDHRVQSTTKYFQNCILNYKAIHTLNSYGQIT